MKITGRIDAHCHLFNIHYGIKEALNIYWDRLNGIYPLDIPQGGTEKYEKEKYATDTLKQLFGWFFTTCGAIFLADQNHYEKIGKDSKSPEGWGAEISVIFPLMMDIFYVFAKPILNAGESYAYGTGIAAQENTSSKVLYNTFHSGAEDLLGHIKSFAHNWEKEFLVTLDALVTEFFESPTQSVELAKETFKDTWGFHCQRMELLNLQKQYKGRIFPFFAVDPRRPGVVEKAIDYVSPGKGFYGIKLYTYMGYHPACAELMPLYEYCAANNVPITVHCSRNGFPSENGWPYMHLADPCLWDDILKKHKNLRVNFAHFGLSPDTDFCDWAETIKQYMETYENVYSDFSCYTTPAMLKLSSVYWNNSARLRERVMFGTDYVVMPLAPGGEALKWYFREFKKYFSDEAINQMAVENPRKFLKLQ